MPAIRQNDILLRLIKDVNDIRAALRQVVANLPLFDIANENTPAIITTQMDNYVPGNYDILMLSSSKSVIMSGIANGVKGRKLQLFNIGANNIILSYENPSSLAKNRFRFQTGMPANIEAGTNLTIYYYSALQRWIAGTEVFDIASNWTSYTCPNGNWNYPLWVRELNLWIVVGGSGSPQVMTSPDGINWTSQTTPAGGDLQCVAWSPSLGILVACGSSRILTSPDGVNWSISTPPFNTTFRSIAWSDSLGIFVIAGGDFSTDSTSQKILTSSNGTTWTERVSAKTKGWSGIVWSDSLGLFVTSGRPTTNTYVISTSSDGIVWNGQVADHGSANGWGRIAWSENIGLFVVIGSSGTGSLTSSDAVNWTVHTNPITYNYTGICRSDDMGSFAIVGNTGGGSGSAFSGDGTTWFYGAMPAGSTSWQGVGWSKELVQFLAVGIGTKVAISP